MRGGRLLGQGSYGCIFSPGFKCASQGASRDAVLSRSKKTVSKVQVYEETAKNEIEIGKKLRAIPNGEHHFQVFKSVCPVHVDQLTDKEIQQCELPSLDNTKLVMLNFSFIQGEHPLEWLRKKKNPLVHLETIMRKLCVSLEKLAEYSILHNDIKENNILIRPSGTPIVLDFGLAVDMSHPESIKKFYYAPDYELWAPDIHILNQEVTDDIIREISYYAIRPLSLFLEKQFLEKYRKGLTRYLEKFKGMPQKDKHALLKSHWDTWDTYALAYLLLECLMLLRTEGHVEETSTYHHLLQWGLVGIHPARRVNPREWLSFLDLRKK